MELPKREKNSHKGTYGRAFILAGSSGMLGAAILCSRGALRVGAGLVYLGVPRSSQDIVNIATPEVIVIGGNNFFDSALKADALAIGPGLQNRKTIAKNLLFNLNQKAYNKPIVLDADGILELTQLTKLTKLTKLITPHPGEMARLLNISSSEVQKDRQKIAKEVAKKINGVVVLKGHQTVIADQYGKVGINQTGKPGMASGGVGDVLTGMIAGLLAQGLPPFKAAELGVYLHGLAGDLAAKAKGEHFMIASDLIDHISEAIKV